METAKYVYDTKNTVSCNNCKKNDIRGYMKQNKKNICLLCFNEMLSIDKSKNDKLLAATMSVKEGGFEDKTKNVPSRFKHLRKMRQKMFQKKKK